MSETNNPGLSITAIGQDKVNQFSFFDHSVVAGPSSITNMNSYIKSDKGCIKLILEDDGILSEGETNNPGPSITVVGQDKVNQFSSFDHSIVAGPSSITNMNSYIKSDKGCIKLILEDDGILSEGETNNPGPSITVVGQDKVNQFSSFDHSIVAGPSSITNMNSYIKSDKGCIKLILEDDGILSEGETNNPGPSITVVGQDKVNQFSSFDHSIVAGPSSITNMNSYIKSDKGCIKLILEDDGILSEGETNNPGPSITVVGQDKVNQFSSFDHSIVAGPSSITNMNSYIKSDKGCIKLILEDDGILSEGETNNPGPLITVIGQDKVNQFSSFDHSVVAGPSSITNMNSYIKSDKGCIKLILEDDGILFEGETNNPGPSITVVGQDKVNQFSSFDHSIVAGPSSITNMNSYIKSDKGCIKLILEDDGILSEGETNNPGPSITVVGQDKVNQFSSFDHSIIAGPSSITNMNSYIKSDKGCIKLILEDDGILSEGETNNPGPSITVVGQDKVNQFSSFDHSIVAGPSSITNMNSYIKSDKGCIKLILEDDGILSEGETNNPGPSITVVGQDKVNQFSSFDHSIVAGPSSITNMNSYIKSDKGCIKLILEDDGILSEGETNNPGPSITVVGQDKVNQFSSFDHSIVAGPSSITNMNSYIKSDKGCIKLILEDDGILSEGETNNPGPSITVVGQDKVNQFSSFDYSVVAGPSSITNMNSYIKSDKGCIKLILVDDGILSEGETNNPGPSTTAIEQEKRNECSWFDHFVSVDEINEISGTIGGQLKTLGLNITRVENKFELLIREHLPLITKYEYITVQDILNDFPIQNDSHLQIIEIKLKYDAKFRKRMMKAVTEIGIIKNNYDLSLMLSAIFDDKFATLYNWIKKKGKKSFSSLIITQIILYSILKHNANTKFKKITESVKDWLQKAEARYQTKLIEDNVMKPSTSGSS